MISKLKLKKRGVSSHLLNCYINVINDIKSTKEMEDLNILKKKRQKIEDVLKKQYGFFNLN